MPSVNSPQKKSLSPFSRKLIRTLVSFHKFFGIFSALFVILIAISGILINHTDTLRLSKSQIDQPWLLNWYQIKAPETIQIYQQEPIILAANHNQLMIADNLVHLDETDIKGAASFIGIILAVSEQSLGLFSMQGETLEKQTKSTGLPQQINAIGIHDGVWLNTTSGTYLSDDDLISWKKANAPNDIPWIQAQTNIAQGNIEYIENAFRAFHLDWEQVLLDLHSGRLFGISGVLFNDFIALILCFLAISGLTVWYKKR